MSMQQPSLAAQTVLEGKDIPVSSAFMMSAMNLSGAVFVPIEQNVFSSHLVKALIQTTGIDACTIIDSGATNLRNLVDPNLIAPVLTAYNKAIVAAFRVAVCMAALGIIQRRVWSGGTSNRKAQLLVGRKREPQI